MDHSGLKRSMLNLSSTGTVVAEIPIPQLAQGGGQRSVIFLAGSAALFDVRWCGKWDLFLGRTAAGPQLVLNTPELAGPAGASSAPTISLLSPAPDSRPTSVSPLCTTAGLSTAIQPMPLW
jgi:hypothetical protein